MINILNRLTISKILMGIGTLLLLFIFACYLLYPKHPLLIVILYAVFMLSGLFFAPAVYVVGTGKFWKGVILTWVLWLALSWIHVFMYCFLVKLSFLVHGKYPDTGGEAFFSAIFMFVLGWIPGLFISGFGMLLRIIFKFFSKLLFKTSDKKDGLKNILQN